MDVIQAWNGHSESVQEIMKSMPVPITYSHEVRTSKASQNAQFLGHYWWLWETDDLDAPSVAAEHEVGAFSGTRLGNKLLFRSLDCQKGNKKLR